MDDTPQCWLHRELTDEQAMFIGRLIAATWPRPDKDARVRADKLLELGADESFPERLGSRSWVLADGDACIAHALMAPREIEVAGRRFWIMGLGSVCTDPTRRGQGLGATIARAAFGVVDEGLVEHSLFQTSHQVRPFYESLGACPIEATVVNSLGDDPGASPFWDEVVMRYPATAEWPEGTIDLRGPGY